MNAIGGYFELELPLKREYHKKALRLNTGRNAFEYILRAKKYNKVFIPYYTCDVILEPLHKLNLHYEFYHIDEQFYPQFDFKKVRYNEAFLYNNYFGICNQQVDKIANKCKNLIIDNSQSFFSRPLPNIDTFYSPRKFFGIPDGAYLYTDTQLPDIFETDNSFNRCEHLLGRIDTGAEAHYPIFQQNDRLLANQPIRNMSNLTRRLLKSIDYKNIVKKRLINFNFFHKNLNKKNKLGYFIANSQFICPMIYPYWIEDGDILRKQLTKHKVYTPQYWTNVIEWVSETTIDYELAMNVVYLPVDHRYNNDDLLKVLKLII